MYQPWFSPPPPRSWAPAFAPEGRRVTRRGLRLAFLRRMLMAAMLIAGTPVVVLYRCESPAIHRVLALLALGWLGLIVPMVRVLRLERQDKRNARR